MLRRWRQHENIDITIDAIDLVHDLLDPDMLAEAILPSLVSCVPTYSNLNHTLVLFATMILRNLTQNLSFVFCSCPTLRFSISSFHQSFLDETCSLTHIQFVSTR